ncbi:MAG: tRNA uridine-5-carboxymethylaminomethyl(34) synthesis GTPase MnmE [Burkholderiales bacterium]
MPAHDTIAAIATAAGRAAVGIVRVSGARVGAIARAVVGTLPSPRQALYCVFRGADEIALDQGVAVFFRAPASFTGEDVLELQGHGSPVALQALLERCIALGARAAEPGEFTRRAFLNDKIDLAQAEAVADLIEASSVEAAQCALRSLRGEFSGNVQILVEGLVNLRAWVEASLDFPEEEVDDGAASAVFDRLLRIECALDDLLSKSRQGSLLREGINVVLIGQPNVGKSTLLNRLAGQELAIVTPYPGTTRDPVRETLLLDGIPLHVVDTAGLRATEDPVERIGMERTWSSVATATVALLVVDATQGFTEGDHAIIGQLPEQLTLIKVFNKIDLVGAQARKTAPASGLEVHLCAKSGAGIELLKQALLEFAGWRPGEEGVFMARARHIAALSDARRHLEAAHGCVAQRELFAEELRLAQTRLNTITGEFSADDLLGEIFARFCIGK